MEYSMVRVDVDDNTDRWENRELGADEEFASLASEADDTELYDLLGKVYHKMATESKPLDRDMAQILSDNMQDLF